MLVRYFKPTPLKMALTVFLTLWVYFYTLQSFKSELLTEALFLIKEGSRFIEWGSPVLMKLSYGTLWIFVTIIIFGAMIIFDRFYTGIHNLFVIRGFITQKSEKPDFLRKAETAIRHERFLIYWIVVFLILYISLFYLSGLSIYISDLLLWQYIYSVPEKYQLYIYLIFLVPFWYLVSANIGFLISVEKKEEQEERLAQEHDATENAF